MTKPIVIYKPRSLIVLPFPFTDRLATKKRPALVIQQEIFQADHGHLIVLMITTAKRTQWLTDVEIVNWQSSGLPAPSVVRQKLFTLEEGLVIKQLGYLSEQDWNAVQFCWNSSIAFNKP